MCDCLYIGGDEIVVLVAEVDIAGLETPEYALDEADALVRCTVLDNDLGSE